ncbi:zinc finger protein 384 L homeolog [Xenopus laevis]|uniref:Zinc finger protein 384 n=1 Tax=Xenopus laevis TaxID=8355 RepID=Q6DDV2_XENLA|nr:zinc finger protein 384 L homeolog [Xenopus laevis]AAH77403.1 Znf384-prov protein [Xenopus laevis]
MEESHFNSSYFWPAVPTVSGQTIPYSYPSQQIDNSMFLNKVKEQLIQEKGCNLSSHYPTLLTVPTSMSLPAGISLDANNKVELHGIQQSQSSVTQNITVLPVPTTGLMTATGLVITSPSGSLVTTPSSSGQTFPITAPSTMIVSALPGSQTLQVVSDLTKAKICEVGTTGTHKSGRGRKKKRLPEPTLPDLNDPYDLSNEDEDEHQKDGKTYRCRMCSITFFSKSEMQIHSKSHTETKPHKCPHCSKSFANSSYLAQHVRIHSGAKPYSCTYCQKAFRQLSHLQQHTRIHTGDRPYKCVHPGCDKAFTQLSNLQSHRRQHNKDKPFKCHNCHRAYTDASALEVHLSTHTVKHAKVYTCSICSRAYTSETYLMKHMRKHNAPEPQQPPPTQILTSHAHFTPVSQAPTSDGPQCSFDMNPFKTDHHKDLCLTVATSTIQVEHLASS